MQNNSLKDLLKDTQKKYHLTKKELSYLEEFLEHNPHDLPEWEAMYGLTPSQIAHQVAHEICTSPQTKHASNGYQPEFFLHLMRPHKSWGELEDGIRNIARYFKFGPIYDFCERKVNIVYSTLRRNDNYGAYDATEDKSHSQRRDIFTTDERKVGTAPSFSEQQCRHCWRTVPVNPHKIARKAPLCPLHDYPSSHPAYRARNRLVRAYEIKYHELRKKIKEIYSAKRETRQDLIFLWDLATSPNSMFPNLSAFIRSSGLELNSARNILTAYHSLGDHPGSPDYKEKIEEVIECILLSSGEDMPLTIFDCLHAEAWLEVTKNCKYP